MTKDWQKELQDELDAQKKAVMEAKALHDRETDELKRYTLEARLRRETVKMNQIRNHMIKVGQKVSISPYSDWHSYTIISRTKDTLTAREDRQTTFKTCWQDGERNCEQDPKGAIIKLTWSKIGKRWCYGIYKVMVGEYNYEDPSF